MSTTSFLLLQFPYSHYNEKARWALDWKRVPHRRKSLLPGPHAPFILRLTGETTVPVLREGEDVIAGSAKIIEALETRFPDPPLYPSDPALRARALEVQGWFDEEVGPYVRRALFSLLLEEPAYVCRMFSEERNTLTRAFYRASFPLAKGLMKKGFGLTGPEAVAEGFKKTAEAFDYVATNSRDTGYLAGDAFTVADLAAAALLGPAVSPADTPMDLPKPRPKVLVEWFERWADHPGAAWVRGIYSRHRPASAEQRA